MVDLSGITVDYGNGPVLDGLDFKVEKGDRVGIVGANGCGKTTLLHTLMGLLTPQSGQVNLFGKTCREEDDFKEARQRIGFVFQNADDQLFCPTVAEDVAFGPRNLGKTSHEAHDIVHKVLDMLGIEHLEARVTHRLSGGEKRLVALATVLAMNPDVLVLDEPTTGLDEKTEERVAEILGKHAETIIVVSHDKGFLEKVTDSSVRLEGGQITG